MISFGWGVLMGSLKFFCVKFLFLFFIISAIQTVSATASVPWKEIKYGASEKQSVFLYNPGELKTKNQIKLMHLIHGGGFVQGDPQSNSIKKLAEQFNQQGFTVVSIGYSLCPKVIWPKPMEDVQDGMLKAKTYLENLNLRISETAVWGNSAGAIAGSLVAFNKKYNEHNLTIDKVLSFAGIYNPASLTFSAIPTLSACKLDPTKFPKVEPYNPDTKSLLFEGEADAFDAKPLTKDSHLEFLEAKLQNFSPTDAYWVKRNGKCDHTCPMSLLVKQDPEITSIVEDFLK